MKTWEREFNMLCGAVADERVSRCINRAAHAAFVAGCAGVAETYKVDVKEQSCLIPNIICKPRRRIKDAFGFVLGLPNGLRYWRKAASNFDLGNAGRLFVQCTLC
jgi:hypothetical protein